MVKQIWEILLAIIFMFLFNQLKTCFNDTVQYFKRRSGGPLLYGPITTTAHNHTQTVWLSSRAEITDRPSALYLFKSTRTLYFYYTLLEALGVFLVLTTSPGNPGRPLSPCEVERNRDENPVIRIKIRSWATHPGRPDNDTAARP